jgi:hypothetical protein
LAAAESTLSVKSFQGHRSGERAELFDHAVDDARRAQEVALRGRGDRVRNGSCLSQKFFNLRGDGRFHAAPGRPPTPSRVRET